ncbi:MAG: hypothetical protein EXR35_05545 [Limnohabitans sp.]|nr:hypothetical protein [Limnohabitans sp.]
MKLWPFNSIKQPRLAWLLALVLMLPLAQTLASVHLPSHVPSYLLGSDDAGKSTLEDACDQCTSAVTLTGGALLQSTTPTISRLQLTQKIQAFFTVFLSASPDSNYPIRAPPTSSLKV